MPGGSRSCTRGRERPWICERRCPPTSGRRSRPLGSPEGARPPRRPQAPSQAPADASASSLEEPGCDAPAQIAERVVEGLDGAQVGQRQKRRERRREDVGAGGGKALDPPPRGQVQGAQLRKELAQQGDLDQGALPLERHAAPCRRNRANRGQGAPRPHDREPGRDRQGETGPAEGLPHVAADGQRVRLVERRGGPGDKHLQEAHAAQGKARGSLEGPVAERKALEAASPQVIDVKVAEGLEGGVGGEPPPDEIRLLQAREDPGLQAGRGLLVKATFDAVKQWLYLPAMYNGVPVAVVTIIDVTFRMGNGPPPQIGRASCRE